MKVQKPAIKMTSRFLLPKMGRMIWPIMSIEAYERQLKGVGTVLVCIICKQEPSPLPLYGRKSYFLVDSRIRVNSSSRVCDNRKRKTFGSCGVSMCISGQSTKGILSGVCPNQVILVGWVVRSMRIPLLALYNVPRGLDTELKK
jgi:hypothetical protein